MGRHREVATKIADKMAKAMLKQRATMSDIDEIKSILSSEYGEGDVKGMKKVIEDINALPNYYYPLLIHYAPHDTDSEVVAKVDKYITKLSTHLPEDKGSYVYTENGKEACNNYCSGMDTSMNCIHCGLSKLAHQQFQYTHPPQKQEAPLSAEDVDISLPIDYFNSHYDSLSKQEQKDWKGYQNFNVQDWMTHMILYAHQYANQLKQEAPLNNESALRFLMDKLNAPEFEDARDEFTETWNCIASIMHQYANQSIDVEQLATTIAKEIYSDDYHEGDVEQIGDAIKQHLKR